MTAPQSMIADPAEARDFLAANPEIAFIEVIFTVSIIVLLFLWHIPSALIPIITIPIAVLLSFIPFRMMGMTAILW